MAIQTFTSGQVLTAAQVNALQSNDFNQTVTTKTANATLVAADKGTRVVMNVSTASTITVNTSIFSAGDTVILQNIASNASTVTAGTATVSSAGSLVIPQFGSGTLFFTSASASIFFPSAGPAPSSGLTFITGASATATASLNITNCFSSNFTVYYVHGYLARMSGNNIAINIRYGTAGTPDTASNYIFTNMRMNAGANNFGTNSGVNDSSANIGLNFGDANNGSNINLIISNPFDTVKTFAVGQSIGAVGNDDFSGFSHFSEKNTATSYTDLNFITASGTLALQYAIYGLAES